MDQVLEKLKRGVRKFRTDVYPQRAELYARAEAEAQQPHTLFITCADSRVDPVEITQSDPGEIFVLRNIGNMVPAYGEMLGGVSAVVEFAVKSLHVQHIVVCGHSDCGAMKALLNPESTADMPTVTSWLKNAHAAREVAEKIYERDIQIGLQKPLLEDLTECNVKLQIQHLRTHPSVAGAMALGELTLSGWIYDIGQGDISIMEDTRSSFHPIPAS